jgi:hypothetical protein
MQVAISTGETVVEAWSSWDKGAMGTVIAPMLHHTGSAWSWPRLQAPTLKVVRDGRADLLNSLCMYYIDYAGVIYCISNRLSWHAGAGNWKGITDGNGHFAGIEAESDGQQWTAATRESYIKLVAAILLKTGNDISWAPRHAEYALPVGRKNDFSGMDAAAFKNDAEFLRVNGIQEDDLNDEQNRMLTSVFSLLGADGAIGTKTEDSLAYVIREGFKPIERYAADGTTKLEFPLRQEIADIKSLLLKGGLFTGDVNVDVPPMSDADKDDVAERVATKLAERLAS